MTVSSFMMLSVAFFIAMLSVVMLSDVMLSDVMLSVVMLNVIMLSDVMLSVVMLNVVLLRVVMLNVLAPLCLPVNIRSGWKGVAATNTLAFHTYDSKNVYSIGPWTMMSVHVSLLN
jgi:hypothetical protein